MIILALTTSCGNRTQTTAAAMTPVSSTPNIIETSDNSAEDVFEYRGKRIARFDSASYHKLFNYVMTKGSHPPHEMLMPVASKRFLPNMMDHGEVSSNFTSPMGRLYTVVAILHSDSSTTLVSYCYRNREQVADPDKFYGLKFQTDGIYIDPASTSDSSIVPDIQEIMETVHMAK